MTDINPRANRNLDDPVWFTRKNGKPVFHFSDCNALKSDLPPGVDMSHWHANSEPLPDEVMVLLIHYANLLEKSDTWPDWGCKLCRNSYEKAKKMGLIA